MIICKILETLLRNFIKTLLSITILVFILIPIFLTVLLPICTYRYFISNWSNLFIPSHGKILTSLSCIFAVDDLTVDPTSTILLTLSLEEAISIEKVKTRVQTLINTAKYPELQQRLTKWMGYFFWKSSPNFSLDDHVLSINQPMGDEDIRILKDTLMKKPYPKDKPLWEIIVLTNYTGNDLNAKTVCFNRFHHCLVDGFSLYKLNSQLSDFPSKWMTAAPKQPTKTFLQKLMIHLSLVAFGPFELVSSMITTFDINEWKVKPGSTAKDGWVAETNKVSLEELKLTAKLHGVSTSALLVTSYIGASRMMMMKYGRGKVPQKMNVVCAFPLPGHPDKLRVHATIVPIQGPLATADSKLRLKVVHEQFDQLKRSILPLAFYYSVKVVGGLFPWMLRILLNRGGMGTGFLTNFQGPKNQVDLFGCKLTGLSVLVGIAHGSHTTGAAFVSYGGQMSITTGFDKALFSERERADEFLELILSQFEILKHCEKDESVVVEIA